MLNSVCFHPVGEDSTLHCPYEMPIAVLDGVGYTIIEV